VMNPGRNVPCHVWSWRVYLQTCPGGRLLTSAHGVPEVLASAPREPQIERFFN